MPATRRTEEPRVKPRSDTYVGILLVSLLGLAVAMLFGYLNWDQVNKEPPAIQSSPPGGGAARPAPTAPMQGGAVNPPPVPPAPGAAGQPGQPPANAPQQQQPVPPQQKK